MAMQERQTPPADNSPLCSFVVAYFHLVGVEDARRVCSGQRGEQADHRHVAPDERDERYLHRKVRTEDRGQVQRSRSRRDDAKQMALVFCNFCEMEFALLPKLGKMEEYRWSSV